MATAAESTAKPAAQLLVTNGTITKNTADADDATAAESSTGGGVFAGGAVTLNNSIVAGNFVDAGASRTPNDIFGALTAANNNLVGDPASAGGLTNGMTGTIVGQDDGVGGRELLDINTVLNATLADNGGPTLTHALLASGPAVDAGNNTFAVDDLSQPLQFDQRGSGFPRINTTVNIGAYEYKKPVASAMNGGNLEITGTGNQDAISLTTDGTRLFINDGVSVQTVLVADITGKTVVINGGDGNDALTVDLSLRTAGLSIVYDGQGQAGTPGDSLVLTGSASSIEYLFNDAHSGSVQVDGSGTDFITYTGLEPINGPITPSADITLIYSDAENDNIVVTDAGGGSGNITVTATNTGETVTFAAPANSLTIRGGGGDDSITVSSLPAGFSAQLTLDGEGGTDSIQVNANLNLGANALSLSAETIQQGSGVSIVTSGLTTLDAGAAGTITLAEPGNDFGTVTIINAGTASLRDANAIVLGAVNVANDFSVTAGAGINEAAATGNIIHAGGNMVFNVNGDIGTSGTNGALDVEVGGTLRIDTNDNNVYITSDQNLAVSRIFDNSSGASNNIVLSTTSTAGLSLTGADGYSTSMENFHLNTETGDLSILTTNLAGNAFDLGTTTGNVVVNAGLATRDVSSAGNVTTGSINISAGGTVTGTGGLATGNAVSTDGGAARERRRPDRLGSRRAGRRLKGFSWAR